MNLKVARIVIISYVLLTAAIVVGDNEKPVSAAGIRAADCCNPCPPLCPPSSTYDVKGDGPRYDKGAAPI